MYVPISGRLASFVRSIIGGFSDVQILKASSMSLESFLVDRISNARQVTDKTWQRLMRIVSFEAGKDALYCPLDSTE